VGCQPDHATLAQALTGHWRAEPRCAVQPAVDQDDVIEQQLRACDGQIAGCLQAFVPPVEAGSPQSTPVRPWRASRSNPPGCAVQTSLEAMSGVDLPQLDGIASLTALKVITHVQGGMTVMRYFPDGLAPHTMSGQYPRRHRP
jgi:hypothetical protein